MKKIIVLISLAVVALIFALSCKKEVVRVEPDTDFDNPYSDVDYGDNPDLIPIDTSSYLGLHKLIFSTKCAVPACHDGAFEPDFRSVQGSYDQLVYHGVVKNNSTNSFTYRIIPNDTGNSWLHERITTDDAILGKMPLYDVLKPWQVKAVEDWILNGAKDIFGNSPNIPNYEPSAGGILAYLNNTSGTRLDTARDNVVAPIKLPASSTVQLWFLLYDTDASGNFVPGFALTHNKIKISTHPYNFTGVAELNLTVLPATSPAMLPIPFATSGLGPFYHSITINTASYTPGKTYYIRQYVKDASGVLTELPEDGSPFYLFTYFSFIVQ
ncbi:MAG: hypothetical protein ACPGVD_02000 [Flavobacteriales bacterium]